MWRNSTSSVSVITSTVLLALAVGASSTAITSDVFRSEDTAIYQNFSSAHQENKVFGVINNTASANAMVSEELQKNIRKIMLISSLKDNWNGNGALAFSSILIEKIKNIVVGLEKQPEIFPTAANSIQLEYDGLDNSYLEIEIFDSKIAEIFRINKDGSEEYFNTNADSESLNRLVTAFYG